MDPRIRWLDERSFELEGVVFELDLARQRPLESDRIVLMKDAALVEAYARFLGAVQPRNVVELGIWGGGSTIFYERLLRPRKLVAVEIDERRAPRLDRYIAERGLGGAIAPHYGVNQGHAERLREVLDAELGSEPVDLVFDDASHLLHQTRASFNLLFPRLRPGGLYFIEDWAWAHWRGTFQEPDGQWAERPALTNLVFELVMALGSNKNVIPSLRIEPGFVAVERGPAKLDAGAFDVAGSYLSRGRRPSAI